MRAHVGAGDLVVLALLRHYDNVNRLARSRNGRASAMARAAVRPPSQHTSTTPGLEGRLLDIGHDSHRPPGFEQRGLDHHFLGGAVLALGLSE